MADLLRQELTEEVHRGTLAAGGSEGISSFEAGGRQFRSLRPKTHTVMLTVLHATRQIEEEGPGLSADDCLNTPRSFDRLHTFHVRPRTGARVRSNAALKC